MKPVPVKVTRVSPAVLPLVVLKAVMVGAEGTLVVNSSADEVVLVPPGEVTVMSRVPVATVGDQVVREVSLLTTKSA